MCHCIADCKEDRRDKSKQLTSSNAESLQSRRGCGVGRGLGVTVGLGVADGVDVGVTVAVGLGVGVVVELSCQVSLKYPLLS